MEAKKIDDVKVELGRLIRVGNQLKKASENEIYYALQVEDESGSEDTERCLLLTKRQIEGMERIVFPLAQDEMKKGRIYPVEINKQKTNLLKVVSNTETFIMRISDSQLADADSRRIRNPEDNTGKSWLTDKFD